MATVKELKNAVQQASKLMTASNPQTLEIYRSIETIHELYSKNSLPVYQKAFDKLYRKKPNAPDPNGRGVNFSDVYDENSATLIAQAYHPDYLAKLVRLEASIDARIDKILHRLMAMKEYKRIVKETRFAKSPTIAPPDPEMTGKTIKNERSIAPLVSPTCKTDDTTLSQVAPANGRRPHPIKKSRKNATNFAAFCTLFCWSAPYAVSVHLGRRR